MKLYLIKVAKTKVIKAIETSLSNPEKRSKSSNKSIILNEDFDLDSLDIAPKEVVENLKVRYNCKAILKHHSLIITYLFHIFFS